MAAIPAIAFGSIDDFIKPCVDCGQMTGRYCEGRNDGARVREGNICLAAFRILSGPYAPFCSQCESKLRVCHFCRNIPSGLPYFRARDSHPDYSTTASTGTPRAKTRPRGKRVQKPESEEANVSGDAKCPSKAARSSADAGPAGGMVEGNPQENQDEDSLQHMNDDVLDILDGEWEEGDVFCGFESQVPPAPAGFSWFPFRYQGEYRLQRI